MHPGRWVRRLAVLAAEAGAEIREGERVGSLADLDAEQVVVATDGYPSGLLGELGSLVIPTRGQMVATAPLAERLYECPHYARHGFDYWQQTADGRLLAGGFRDESLLEELTTDERTTPVIQAALEAFVTELAGHPVEITHRWAGLFGLVLDFLPVVGRVPGDDRHVDRGRATPATGTSSDSSAASSWRARCSARRHRSSLSSILPDSCSSFPVVTVHEASYSPRGVQSKGRAPRGGTAGSS